MLKAYTKTVLDRTGAPASTWMLCLDYVSFVLNHLASKVLKWHTPLEALTGSTPDISAIPQFRFWEPVYYRRHDSSFPSDTHEEAGHFVGFATSVGDALTYLVLTDNTSKVLHRSTVRWAVPSGTRNLRLEPLRGEFAQACACHQVYQDQGAKWEPAGSYYQPG